MGINIKERDQKTDNGHIPNYKGKVPIERWTTNLFSLSLSIFLPEIFFPKHGALKPRNELGKSQIKYLDSQHWGIATKI